MDYRNFLETSQNFYAYSSKHEKTTSYLSFALATGFTAMTGFGMYMAAESDTTGGLLVAGVGAYGTKKMIESGFQFQRMSKEHEAKAEERTQELVDLDTSELDTTE